MSVQDCSISSALAMDTAVFKWAVLKISLEKLSAQRNELSALSLKYITNAKIGMLLSQDIWQIVIRSGLTVSGAFQKHLWALKSKSS